MYEEHRSIVGWSAQLPVMLRRYPNPFPAGGRANSQAGRRSSRGAPLRIGCAGAEPAAPPIPGSGWNLALPRRTIRRRRSREGEAPAEPLFTNGCARDWPATPPIPGSGWNLALPRRTIRRRRSREGEAPAEPLFTNGCARDWPATPPIPGSGWNLALPRRTLGRLRHQYLARGGTSPFRGGRFAGGAAGRAKLPLSRVLSTAPCRQTGSLSHTGQRGSAGEVADIG